jgi:tRNA G18 (ribose-2'-O)-methylase SpoU
MNEVVVILDNIRSTFNVGSVLRTGDGAGIKKLYLAGITPTPAHPKIKKTALGAENYLEWEHVSNTLDLIQKLKQNGFKIISIEQTPSAQNYKEVELVGKIAFIFGNEISGVNPEILEASDLHLELPMKGQKNSLNISTTVGIILYHYCV